MSEPEGWTYDPVELGRRIVFAFSAGELQRFAGDLGVAAEVRWERGHAEAARDVVRQFEKSYGGLPTLVDRLRSAKPLVEWPEPGPPPSQARVAPGPEAPPIALVSHGFAPAPALGSPGSLGGPPGPTIPQAPAFAPPIAVGAPAAPAPSVPPPSAAPSGPVAPAPAIAAPPPPPAPPWPGTFAPAAARAPASNGLDPKILVAVAGLMVVAAVIAYLAGRAGSANVAAADASAQPAGSAQPARRPDGPATRLASAVDRGVANVARACEVAGGPAEEVFSRSFDQCGPGTAQRPAAHRSSPFPLPRESAGPREPRARPAGPNPRREAPGAACMKNCAAESTACRSRCGPEPSEASRYGSYQQCMGNCITRTAKCKLSCP